MGVRLSKTGRMQGFKMKKQLKQMSMITPGKYEDQWKFE